jgi:hypothetical protein
MRNFPVRVMNIPNNVDPRDIFVVVKLVNCLISKALF